MTINTLEYIHKLLKDEEWKTNQVYKGARSLQHQYEESEHIDKDLIKSQEEAADKFMQDHLEALTALRDFENQEW